jgi:hypothetical protein
MHVLEVAEPVRRERAQPVEFGFLLGDAGEEIAHGADYT